MWAADLREASPPPRRIPVNVREVTAGSAAALVEAMGEEGDLVAVRLARGCRCFAAWQDGELIAYGWLSAAAEWIGELEVEITPGDGEAYVWNCVTLAPHRRKGVFRTLLVDITSRARSEGLARLWIGSVDDPAEKAAIDAGFVRALNFEVSSSAGVRRLAVSQADGAGSPLVRAALGVLAAGGRPLPLGTTTQRTQKRRH